MTRAFLTVAFNVAMLGCSTGPEVTRLQARPGSPSVAIQPGEHPLGLNPRRDGTLYIPGSAGSRTSVPLLVLLHGAGQRKELFRFTFPPAEELGVVILALDSRDSTWDGIAGPFGPDVLFIDAALRHTFDRVAVDPRRLALGGFSDGASYSTVARARERRSVHAPGRLLTGVHRQAGAGSRTAADLHVARNTGRVLGIEQTSRRLVPQLRSAGYQVTYREFDGPHTTPPPSCPRSARGARVVEKRCGRCSRSLSACADGLGAARPGIAHRTRRIRHLAPAPRSS